MSTLTPTDLSQPGADGLARHEDGATALNARKRPRATRAGSTYARKRAVAACELCRSRKAKCDNQRPCSTCVSFGATCVFKDRESDYSTFDNASLAILDRVNYAVRLLEQSHNSLAGQVSDTSPANQSSLSPVETQNNGAPHTPYSNAPPSSSTAAAIDDSDIDKLSVNTRCACTHVLEWPIFEGLVKPASVNPALYGDSTGASSTSASEDGTRAKGVTLLRSTARIDERDVRGLVQDFLRDVHIKNPILDRAELLGMAHIVAEEGFQWDASSCLVLIACALGSISSAWEAVVPSESESSLDDKHSHALADAYYTAARKRLGLLETSLQAIQCWFLLGVFEMYAMRPLNGWSSFSRACNLLELRLYIESQHSIQGLSRGERRLYWSCLKSEAELREEFDLPEPGLARIDHPYVLPSPPETPSAHVTGIDEPHTVWETVHKQSWYYYLADIAYRRITNRTLAALYSAPKELWPQCSIPRLYNIAEELDAQVLQWWQTIPGSPTPACHADTDELTYMLYLNYADLRERIWRPFLYIAVHSDPQDTNTLVMTGASKCVELSMGMLQNALLKHRHHGCWQTIRCMFSKALGIVAAAKCQRVALPSDWRQYIEVFQGYMQYWESEAPDIGAANRALSTLLESLQIS